MSNPAHTYALDAESDFIAECMSEMADEHPDMEQDQKLAVCYAKFGKGERHMSALHLDSDAPKPMGEPTEKDGQRRQKFVKDSLHVGSYKHPRKGWTLDISADRLGRFVKTFRRMKENGVAVEVVANHGQGAADVHGYLDDMFFVGDRLFTVPEMRGDDAISLAQKCKTVSVLIDPDFVDGKGNHYGEAITHLSVSQQPIVPGQSDFIPLARDGKEASARVFMFAGEPTTRKEPAMLLDELRKLLGLKEEDTEESCLEALKKKLSPEAAAEAAEALSLAQKEVARLKGELASKEAKPLSMDPDLLDQTLEVVESKLASLVEKGKITPAAAKLFSTNIVGDKANPKLMFLSRKGNPGSNTSLARVVLDIIEANDPVELVEKTGCQVIAMSRQVPDAASNQPDPDVMAQVKKSNPPEK